jgi:acetate---CoA ligase (ADP-forming)
METVAAARRQSGLRRLFEPRSVAILGASEMATKPGGRPIVYLSQTGFGGRVYPINPRHAELFGYRCFPSLAALPEIPDLVVVAIPAHAVVDAVRESAAAGVGAMVIYSSGFAELGREGAAMERQIRDLCNETGLVVCGPNCQGVTNLFNGLAVNFSTALSEGQPRPGPVAIVSQSGLVGALATAECMARGLGIGYLVSTGNEAGFEFADAVLYLAEDERVRVILGYLEGVRDVGRFRRAAESARGNGKPLVILKVGRSPQAARVAATHTGAMAVPSRLYEALSEELGIVSVASVEAMIDAALAFARLPQVPRGNRVAVMGNSGGFAVLCADDVHRFGLALAPLAPATIAALARTVPPYIVPQNPVDLVSVPMDDPPAAVRVLDSLAADDATDLILCCFGAVRRNVAALASAVVAFARTSPKPLLVAWLASAAEGMRILEEGEVPVFTDTSRAVRAIKTLVEARTRPLPAPAKRRLSESILSDLREACARAIGRGRTTLGEAEALPLLARAGLSVPRLVRVASPAEAAAAFPSFQGPVAVKLDCDAVLHKSEIGGVRLDIRSAQECAQACREVLENAARKAPAATPHGVLVAQMMAAGAEVMIGVERDPRLGAFVAVGLGGLFVEVMGDITFHAAPVDPAAARGMLRRLKAFPLLEGARGRAPADIEALADAIAIVSEIAAGVPEIAEMDLNPVIVGAAGKGLAVVDAVIRLRQD